MSAHSSPTAHIIITKMDSNQIQQDYTNRKKNPYILKVESTPLFQICTYIPIILSPNSDIYTRK